MNLTVENALAAWLRSLEAFEGITIHTGQSNDEIPGDAPAIIVACESSESVGQSLHRANAAIILSTPSMLDLDQHRTLADALRAAIYSPSGLSAAFLPAVLHGAVLTAFGETQSNDRWTTTAQLVLGAEI